MERWETIDLRSDPDEAEHRGDPGELVDAAGFFLALVDRPAWMRDGLCSEHPGIDWFGGEPRRAKEVCQRCLVRPECLAYSLGQPAWLIGVWGGLSGLDRKHLRRLSDAA